MDSASIVFDRYRLEERIGAGGMGVVWKAIDLRLSQPVALKRISLAGVDAVQAELIRARALREARTAARLRGHPHVVATYDVHIDSGDIWLVLEYLPSRTLAALRREQGRLEIAEVARIGAAVADALAAGHARDIVHRDVTPANVLIATDGTVKLTDFGISRLTGADEITQEGIISGTIAYLAPEVAASCEYTPASDVFSLGSTLYAAIEGQPPFGTDDNTLSLLKVIRTGIIREPTSAGALTSLLLRLLERDPKTRPDAATARDLLTGFVHRLTAPTEYLPPIPDDSPQPPSPPHERPPPQRPTQGPRWLRRHRALAVVLALVTLTGFGVGIGFGVRSLTSTGRPALVGAPPLPSTVGPITLTGDAKAADPCALIDQAWLHQFGNAELITPELPSSCRVQITLPDGRNASLDVGYNMPVEPVARIGGQPQQLGALTILRKHWVLSNWGTPSCENVLVLADNTQIIIDAYGPSAHNGFGRCKLAEVGTATTINELAEHGITYRAGRTDAWPITRSDACTLLTNTELATLGGADPTIRIPGYANWWCRWGTSTTNVTLRLRLETATIMGHYGSPTTIAGRRAWLQLAADTNPHQCLAVVLSHPARSLTDTTEMIQVSAQAAEPDQTLCSRASNLAAAAITRVPAT